MEQMLPVEHVLELLRGGLVGSFDPAVHRQAAE